jgi:monoamine oxidase
VTGDCAVSAIPFSVLRTVAVSPAFSAEKALAICELSHKLLARTYIQCRQRFWVDQGLSGYASTDLPKTYFSESTVGQPGYAVFCTVRKGTK